MNNTVRVAFLGARHPHVFPRIDVLRGRPNVELLGFFEPDRQIAARLSERTGLKSLSDSELHGIDLAVVEGLDFQLPELAELAVRAGARAVLLEKPGAQNPQAFYSLADRLTSAGVIVELGYQLHYSDAVGWCREIVEFGVLGQLTASRFHGGCPVGAGAELWQSLAEDIGGIVYTEGSHMLEIVHDLFGAPEEVSASVRRLPPGEPVPALIHKPDLFSDSVPAEFTIGALQHEDIGMAMLEYPNQTVSVDFTAWEPTTWCAQWWIELYGTNGSLVAIPQPSELKLTLREPGGRFGPGETVLSAEDAGDARLNCYRRQLDSLLSRLGGDASADRCDLSQGRGVIRMLDAIYASAQERTWVSLSAAAPGAPDSLSNGDRR